MIAPAAATLPCQSYNSIGSYCNDGEVPPKPFSRCFGVNPAWCQWLRRIVHRSDLSGTMIAYWNGDPQSFTERVAAR